MSDDERRRAFHRIHELRDLTDDDATRELVALLESDDESITLEAGRVLDDRDVPDDVRDRVIAGLLSGTRRYTHRAGARALVMHANAFALAEPVLRVDVVADPDTRDRAISVLHAIEAQLARRSLDDRVPLPDPRFRELAAEVARLDPELDGWVQPVINAYRFFAGEDVRPPWLRVEFFPDEQMPVIVAGVRVSEVQYGIPDGITHEYPPGLTAIGHQYGGYSCNQHDLFGYVLVPDPAMHAVLTELTNHLYGSQGEHMGAGERAHWNELLAPLFAGTITEISEGLVLADARPAALVGLEIMRFGTRFAPWRWGIDGMVDKDFVLEGRFTREHERALAALGDKYGLAPQTAAVLENCD